MHFLHSSIVALSIVQVQQKHNCRGQQRAAPPAACDERKKMTMAYVSQNRATTVTLADRFAAAKANLVAAYEQRKLYNATFRELSALSNRELADLGIHRSMIKSIALEAATK